MLSIFAVWFSLVTPETSLALQFVNPAVKWQSLLQQRINSYHPNRKRHPTDHINVRSFVRSDICTFHSRWSHMASTNCNVQSCLTTFESEGNEHEVVCLGWTSVSFPLPVNASDKTGESRSRRDELLRSNADRTRYQDNLRASIRLIADELART